jgi:hypothetical protein
MMSAVDNVEERLLDHLRSSDPNTCIKSLVAGGRAGVLWARVPKAQLGGVEKYLDDHYKPRCNRADPGGTPIQVNLPS